MAEKARRRTQAERSAGTREVLLAAAIDALHEHGYAATSTMLVAEKAGVSRGAMLHQFRTAADLMTFVVEAVFDEELERYSEYLTSIKDPEQRLLAYPEMAWDVLSRPSGVAVLEIFLGSRSDPQLCEKLAPVQARIEEQALAFTRLAAPGDVRGAMALMRLVVWAVRGLSVAQVLAPAPGSVRDSVKLLRRLMAAGLETGVLSVGAKQDK
ncbi:Transcriptional regulator, TetR family [Sphingopyxis sp. LC81]|uniref:TetR/AcrR family transcriptional regulator n=1 Tax=Sphingopyxis sp. LC81 TaxID=1502850 RepID=UPI00050F4C6E|nr:TetR/AcrR family transcriptional regulator [Sphingopyxis sp. LC81]KGB53086.1 Transcriptional regulator, TetR family [Sphingopyxis sp. LC81]